MDPIILPTVALVVAVAAAIYAARAERRCRAAERTVLDLIDTLQSTPRAADGKFDIL